jgi:hypothetical protein
MQYRPFEEVIEGNMPEDRPMPCPMGAPNSERESDSYDDDDIDRARTSPPPPIFEEVRRQSRGPAGDEEPTTTLPSAQVVPRLVVDAGDLAWFDADEASLRLAALVDGQRSVIELARLCGLKLSEAQFCIANLRDRNILALDRLSTG